MDDKLKIIIKVTIFEYNKELTEVVKEVFNPESKKYNSSMAKLMAMVYGCRIIEQILKLYHVQIKEFNEFVKLLGEVVHEI